MYQTQEPLKPPFVMDALGGSSQGLSFSPSEDRQAVLHNPVRLQICMTNLGCQKKVIAACLLLITCDYIHSSSSELWPVHPPLPRPGLILLLRMPGPSALSEQEEGSVFATRTLGHTLPFLDHGDGWAFAAQVVCQETLSGPLSRREVRDNF